MKKYSNKQCFEKFGIVVKGGNKEECLEIKQEKINNFLLNKKEMKNKDNEVKSRNVFWRKGRNLSQSDIIFIEFILLPLDLCFSLSLLTKTHLLTFTWPFL